MHAGTHTHIYTHTHACTHTHTHAHTHTHTHTHAHTHTHTHTQESTESKNHRTWFEKYQFQVLTNTMIHQHNHGHFLRRFETTEDYWKVSENRWGFNCLLTTVNQPAISWSTILTTVNQPAISWSTILTTVNQPAISWSTYYNSVSPITRVIIWLPTHTVLLSSSTSKIYKWIKMYVKRVRNLPCIAI